MFSFIKKLKNFFGKNPLSREKFTRKNAFPNKPIEKPRKKICPRCKKSFVPKSNHQKFCSRECYKSGKKLRERERNRKSPAQEKTCLHCGKTFETAYPNKKFCSRECQIAFNAAKKKLPQIERNCLQCGKNFATSNLQKIFCSAECRIAFNKAKNKKPEVEKTCPTCGKNFAPEFRSQIYCSEDCRPSNHQIIHYDATTCPICGKTFVPKNKNQTFCSAWCAGQRVKKKESNIEIKSCQVPKKSLQQWMAEAAQCGMSYGKYRAAVEHLGETFENLKAKFDAEKKS